jgi:plasmid stability protein
MDVPMLTLNNLKQQGRKSMSALVIPDLDETTLARLRERATKHGRTPEKEAQAILMVALHALPTDPWAAADAFRERLAASGRDFGDSAEDVREDRER